MILYISYHNSKKIYNIEKNYKEYFDKYNIQDIFTLFDITDIKDNNKNYNEDLNKLLDINVTGFPAIIYYENGQISLYKKISSASDFEEVIKKIWDRKK